MAKKTPQPAPRSFEDALRELEGILQQIEAGSLGLEESLTKYERGNFLIQHCRGVLSTAEKQIEQISGSAETGLTVAPMKLRPSEEPANVDDADGDEGA